MSLAQKNILYEKLTVSKLIPQEKTETFFEFSLRDSSLFVINSYLPVSIGAKRKPTIEIMANTEIIIHAIVACLFLLL